MDVEVTSGFSYMLSLCEPSKGNPFKLMNIRGKVIFRAKGHKWERPLSIEVEEEKGKKNYCSLGYIEFGNKHL